MTPYSKAWWGPQEQQLSKSLDLKYFDWCHTDVPPSGETEYTKNSYCSFLINWQWAGANTINLPTQWKVPLRILQQQRSRENLESKSFEKPQGSVFQEKKTNIGQRTWKVAKDVDDEKGEKLIFSWDKAGCDWVTVKIPVRCRRFKDRRNLEFGTFWP